MAQGMLCIRKEDKVPAWATDADGHWKRGDICGVHKFALEPTERERKAFAWVRITDIPAEIALKVKKWMSKRHFVGGVLMRPRVLNIDIPLLKAEYPALASQIDKLFDPTFTLPSSAIPELTFTKFRNCVWDKINVRVVPEAQWEDDTDE